MRLGRWFELLKDYDVWIRYHLGKVNVVVYAHSRKTVGQVSFSFVPAQLASDIDRFGLEIYPKSDQNLLSNLTVELTLISCIKIAQENDGELWFIQNQILDETNSEIRIDDDDTIWVRNRLCVPNDAELKEAILEEK